MFTLCQCFLFTDISGPSFGPVQTRDVLGAEAAHSYTSVGAVPLWFRLLLLFCETAGQGEDLGNLLLSNEAPRAHMTHALRDPADAFHQQPAGMCLQEGSQTDALHRLFLLLQHGSAWNTALGCTAWRGKKGRERQLELTKAPANFCKSAGCRSHRQGRGNHSMARRDYWAAG